MNSSRVVMPPAMAETRGRITAKARARTSRMSRSTILNQLGRIRDRFCRMLLMTLACISTPGDEPKGMLRMSWAPTAVLPTSTILPLNAFIRSTSGRG